MFENDGLFVAIMKKLSTIILALAVLLPLAMAQNLLVLDPWMPEQSLVLQITDLPADMLGSSVRGSMLGGERDLLMTDVSGTSGRIVTTGISGGEWTVAYQSESQGRTFLIYDGIDNSTNINYEGLGCFDLTAQGAYAFRLRGAADLDTAYSINLYASGTNGAVVSSFNFTLPGDQTEHEATIFFDQFSGPTDFTFSCIGAIVIEAVSQMNRDSYLSFFGLEVNNVCGQSFLDCNGNGVLDSGEAFLVGGSVTSTNVDSGVVSTAVFTNSTGYFEIGTGVGTFNICFAETSLNGASGNLCQQVTLTAGQTLPCLAFPFSLVPAIVIPVDVALPCGASTAPSSTGTATATGCGIPVITFTDVQTPTCGTGAFIINRTWLATFPGGETLTGLQVITLTDTVAPSFVFFPNNANLQGCALSNIAPEVLGFANATDACGPVTVTFSDSAPSTSGCQMSIQRTWTATDACGNFITRIQSISSNDNVAPTFTFVPAAVELSCNASITPEILGFATATDDCGAVQSLTFQDSVANDNNNHCRKQMKRVWTATDACGNHATATQTFALVDNDNPIFEFFPLDATVECDQGLSGNAVGTPRVSDACSPQAVSLSFNDRVINNNGCAGGIARTWVATDGCGNRISRIQNITRIDTKPPKLYIPQDRELHCDSDFEDLDKLGKAHADDNCSNNIRLTYVDTREGLDSFQLGECPGPFYVNRRWTATDECGNSVSAVQTLKVHLRDTQNNNDSSSASTLVTSWIMIAGAAVFGFFALF